MDTTTTRAARVTPTQLTVFAFLWACQALVHQDFFSQWLADSNPLGWLVTLFGLATILWPRRVMLFALMLVSSVAYNVEKWPFVVNHILVESLINLTILAAMAAVLLRGGPAEGRAVRRRHGLVVDRFAPVVRIMLVVLYYFAFVAKLNTGFLHPDLSCVSVMYADLVDRFPFLPENHAARVFSIGLTIAVEAAIPILLSFRRTRYLAIAIGLPFHLILGLVGHRTFSALAYALYGLFCLRPLTALVIRGQRRLQRSIASEWRSRALAAARTAAGAGILALVAAAMTGNRVFVASWLLWLSWSFVLAVAYLAIIAARPLWSAPIAGRTARPGLLWLMLVPVVVNGIEPYIGLKTETSFTMYSNLRTEGGMTNHLFVPVMRVAGYQDDLVEIVETDHPELAEYQAEGDLITFFEFRRIVSSSAGDFLVIYKRDGEQRAFRQAGGESSDAELSSPYSLLVYKLLYFRPVQTGAAVACKH